MKRNFSLIILFFAYWAVAIAQVNIGSNDLPEGFSVLQLTGTDGGLRINQLNATQVSVLESSIKTAGKLDEAQGLLVYNTTEGCYNMFKGEKFESLCATASQAVFDPNNRLICGSLEIYGEYMEEQPLDGSHYLRVNVLCTKPGTYTFIGTMHNENGTNGYSFTKSDIMLEAGRHVLTVPASGTPVNPGLDTLHISINQTKYSCPDDLISVKAAPERAVYRITDATPISQHQTVEGVPYFRTNLNYNNDEEDAIQATVRVTQGGEATELTAIINGVEFKYTPDPGTYWTGPDGYLDIDYKCNGTPTDSPSSCLGELTADTVGFVGDTTAVVLANPVILKSTGNPVNYGWHDGRIRGRTGKNGAMVFSPPVSVLFLSRAIRIIGASSGDFYNVAHPGPNNNLPYQMISEPGNFIYKNKDNPGQYIEDITFQELNTQPTQADLNNADIVNLGYNTAPSGTDYPIINYVKNKQGVLLFFSQNATPSVALIKAITGETITLNSAGAGGTTYPFEGDTNDPIVNNIHFGTLIGKRWGEDAGATNNITSTVPARFIVYSRNSNNEPNSFRDSRLGFIWVGDGGFVSNAAGTGSNTAFPFNIDNDKKPAAQTYYSGSSWNSLFVANSIWWAIDYLRKNGRID